MQVYSLLPKIYLHNVKCKIVPCKTGKLELVDVMRDQCLLKTRGPCLNNTHTHTHTLAEETDTRQF